MEIYVENWCSVVIARYEVVINNCVDLIETCLGTTCLTFRMHMCNVILSLCDLKHIPYTHVSPQQGICVHVHILVNGPTVIY